ncbi:alpha/beta hydrolase family protein [Cohnella sp. GCM10027633]|uniref:alpha/beta hydrolase family protein n=1 Tax=unclassified Cohnella TaxID=2636738 RepID=UPI0036328BD3
MELRNLERYRVPIYDLTSQLRDYVNGRTTQTLLAGERARRDIADVEALTARKAAVRGKLLEGIGGLPPLDTPLRPRTMNVLRLTGFSIESIVFEPRPGTYATANVYVPDTPVRPGGAVLFVCGHRERAKQDPDYQMVCQKLANAGLVVMALDPIGQGERYSYADVSDRVSLTNAADHEHAGAQCWPLGDGIARYFLHDIMRALDYLSSREDVDPSRIGMTGNSGGGVQTSLAMMCDDRIAAAAPATFLSTREAIQLSGMPQDAEQIWPGMAGAGFDHADVALAFAPRPLLVLAATEDFFPIEGTRKTLSEVRRYWELHGKGDDLRLFEEETHHQYSEAMADAAAAFFASRLFGRSEPWATAPLQLLEPSLLRSTRTGQVKLDEPNARAVYDENVDRLAALEEERNALPPDVRLARAKQWLTDRVIAPRVAADANPRPCDRWELPSLSLTATSWIWFSQERMMSHAFAFRASGDGSSERTLPLTIGLWEGGTSRLEAHADWIAKTCAEGRIALVLNVSGEGALSPNSVYAVYELKERFGTLHKFDTDLYGLEDSLAALRTFEVCRAMDAAATLRGVDRSDVQLYAEGGFGMYASLAKILADGDYEVRIEDGLASVGSIVRDRLYSRELLRGLILPGMLRYFDLPDIV